MPYNRHYVETGVMDALKDLGMSGDALNNWSDFIVMIIAHESAKGRYIKQIKGPALGLSQMEPATHDDIAKYLNKKPRYRDYFNRTFGGFDANKLYDLHYMACMSRCFFLRFPEPLPDGSDYSLAQYAKKRWNTHLGKATPEDYLDAYKGWK